MANMPINLNQVLRGVGNTDPLVAEANLSFVPGSGIAMTSEAITATGTVTGDAATTLAEVVVIQAGGADTGLRFSGFTAGQIKLVYNGTSTDKKIYPTTGGRVNGYTVDQAFTLGSGLGAMFAALSTGGMVAALIS